MFGLALGDCDLCWVSRWVIVTPVGLIVTCIALIVTPVGSARHYRYQHVGIGNANHLRWGLDPM